MVWYLGVISFLNVSIKFSQTSNHRQVDSQAPLVHKQVLVGLLVRGNEIGNDLCHRLGDVTPLHHCRNWGWQRFFSEPGCSLKQFFPIYPFSALLSQVSYLHCGLKFISSDSCSFSFYFSQTLPPKSLTHLTLCWQLLLRTKNDSSKLSETQVITTLS